MDDNALRAEINEKVLRAQSSWDEDSEITNESEFGMVAPKLLPVQYSANSRASDSSGASSKYSLSIDTSEYMLRRSRGVKLRCPLDTPDCSPERGSPDSSGYQETSTDTPPTSKTSWIVSTVKKILSPRR